MITFKARAEALARTEEEIRSEMASALGRIGRTLAGLIEEMETVARQLQRMPESERRLKLEHYSALRSQAKLYRWYLTVQRESIGIRNHDSLSELYRIPDHEIC